MIVAADLSSFAGRMVLTSVWQGVLLTLVTALGLRLAPRLSAASRFLVWTFTLLAMIVLPLVTAFSGSAASVSASPALHLSPVWGMALAGLWLLLCAYRVIELLVGFRHLVRVAGDAQPILADRSTAALLAASPRSVQLCVSSQVDAPCIAGFRSARLLLPAELQSSLEAADLQAIVLHELEHLRRRDDWINLASKLAIVAFPFNPALLWLDHRLGLERELACDASVVAATNAPFRYAGSLTRLAERRVARRVALVLAAWGRHSEVVQRVSALLGPVAPASPWRRRAAMALVSGSLVATSCALLQAPQIVSFAPAGGGDRSMALVSGPHLPVVPAAERALVLPAAFHPEAATAQGVLVRPRRAGRTRAAAAAAQPFSQLPRTAETPRTVLTSIGQRSGQIRARSRRVRTPAAVRWLQTDFSTFAAVPFGDGWLIVQL